MPQIIINEIAYEVPADITVLAACQSHDIWIPTLCHHPALSEYGACRLCLVELVRKGRTKITASCTLPVHDGMEIRTDSEALRRQRRLVMELVLASCPDAPAVQEMAVKLGARRDRLDANHDSDCIRCGLCVRACAEISTANAISFANRGVNRTISTPFGIANPECVLCGACTFVCPTGSRLLDLAKIAGESPAALLEHFDADLKSRGAIHRPFPQALPNVPAIDCDACLRLNKGGCGICEKVCAAGAINFNEQDRTEELEVGAVILAPGYEEFRPREQMEIGYSRFPDVVTSLEFERILSASGPCMGHVRRASDGREPRRIAFIQCVGSRDIPCRHGYCSSVCCMYAVKQAFIAKEHLKDVDTTIFLMDLRAFGKDFDKYCERAEHEHGVNFQRARVYGIEQPTATGPLLVKFAPEQGGVAEAPFDLVVLSVGLQPNADIRQLAQSLGIRLNEFGFVWTEPNLPPHTSRAGVYVAGAASGPKDIPETVVQASAAACEAGRLLADVSGSLTRDRQYPVEKNVAAAPPRIGVFVCHCGINIGGIVDVPAVAEYIRAMPNVVYSEDNLYTCSQDSQEHLKDMIQAHDLNRVVIASCSPRTHEPLFQETLRESGLNPYLIVMANIRDQCSWAHMKEPVLATAKAQDLVRMAVAKARLLKPLHAASLPVNPRALVIGAGLAGMTAALAIADRGHEVYLVEKEQTPGGNLQHLYEGFDNQDLQALNTDLQARIAAHPLIEMFLETTVAEVAGFVGSFKSRLHSGRELEHGVVIVATGAQEYEGDDYGYGLNPGIMSQRELAEQIARDELPWQAEPPGRIVMIQCVGSRNEQHPYCSRVCCTRAVRNAIRLKQRYPATEINVLYRDIRTYGLHEKDYQKARELGVVFTRFTPGLEPQVDRNGELTVTFHETLLDRTLKLRADAVVLSTGIVANGPANEELAKLVKVPLNDDKFFLEAHVKLRPVEFATEGVFVAGLAHGPKTVDETVGQALAAVSRAFTILEKDLIATQSTIAEVDLGRCVACGLCEELCPYGAIALASQKIGREERLAAQVNPALCKGCGACTAGCRSGAINLNGFTDQQILAEILQL